MIHSNHKMKLLLLLAAMTLANYGVDGAAQAGAKPSLKSAPAELVQTSAENLRFSRLLKESANVLQFSSISNDAPPIWGIREAKAENKGQALGDSNFGRRALDYDETHHYDEPSETKIIANPFPGNEYVYVKPGRLQQEIQAPDSDIAASVTSINNKPPRVPLALLRQKKGKRVNISPLFTEVPQVQQESDALAKEFVWVDQPSQHVGINRQGRKHEEVNDDATTNPAFQDEDLVEATTLPEEIPIETTTTKEKQKMVVNVITSVPRFSVETNATPLEKKSKGSRFRTKSTTTPAATTEAVTTPPTTTTTEVVTTVSPPVLSSSSPKSNVGDEKENLVTDANNRAPPSFQGFEDSQTKLHTAESSQPARVNVRPAQNGKEYEYEYIYYYYDDDDEKNGEPGVKAVGQGAQDVKTSPSPSTTSTTAADAASSTVTASSTSTTTSPAPPASADTDFEYEDDAALEEQQVPEIQKSTPTASRTTDEPVHKGVSSAEKLSNSNPINQLDRSRGPKIIPAKFEETADYKLETEASQEDETIQAPSKSRGQPIREPAQSSEEEEAPVVAVAAPEVAREPSTAAPVATSAGFDMDNMSTLAKNHKDSVNVPIVLKQSTLLKAVPISQLQPHVEEITGEQPSTSPITTPSTTTTVEAASEVAPSVRPSPTRLRGQRLRGSITPRPVTSTAAPEQPAAEEKPQQAVRRPNLRESASRRVPARRPVQETADAPEQQPAASPIIEHHARPLPIRPRFPPRTGQSSTTAAAPVEVEVPAASVTASAIDLNSLEDKKSKDSHVRSKSANDLYAFTRLQQAISSRAPSRVPPKLVAGFVNSAEVTTDAMTSSEVTTVSSFGGQSSETIVADDPPSSTTTTTTTTEAVQLDKFGRQRNKFGGRTRRPLGGGASAGSTTTTETPVTSRNRFTGRRRGSTTEAPEGTVQQTSAPATNSEAPKPRIPSRNRFSANRNRGSTTEASVTAAEGQKTAETEKPATPGARRRPGTFQGRRRPNQVQAQTEAPTAPEETASVTTNEANPSTDAITSTAAPAPVAPGRNRFNFGAAGGRVRPTASPAAASNPVRIRGGGRLRGPTTTTTTEAAPAETQAVAGEEEPADAEQSPTIQSENLEPIVTAPEAVVPARGGVLGRLKNRPKLVVTTTTTAPEAGVVDRKGSRLNGILNRRKNLGQLQAAVQVKETVSEVTEEASNHAQEQTDDDHKGVVVQISSSVTESEEVNDTHAGEVVEPSSTTAGSILNRLKSQRKPGSLFRKKPDPHGE